MDNRSAKFDERLPVWEALSEFFLDTELTAEDYDRLAGVLSQSEYPVEKLEQILQFEVFPVCKWNLFSVAGVWTAFDLEFLDKKITPRKDRLPWMKWKPLHWWMVDSHWREVKDRIANLRMK